MRAQSPAVNAMALDLEIAGEIRELTDAELAEIAPARPPVLKRLRDSHHAVARALASGLPPQQVSSSRGIPSPASPSSRPIRLSST
jgi:hypothetical protein